MPAFFQPLPLIVSGLLLHAGALASTPVAGLHFSHHDWEVACDNTRTCRAAGYTADAWRGEASDGTASILFTRQAGPRQAVTGQVRFADWYEATLPTPTVHLRIDGRDLGALPVAPGQDADLVDLAAAQVQALLAALRRDSSIVFVDATGSRWPLSDRGAAAVLLKMDEFQGRVGTVGALARVGTRDETGVLPAAAMPRVRIAPLPALHADDARLAALSALRQALRASLGPDQECLSLDPDEDEKPLEVVARLDDTRVLVATECWMAAYNMGVGYWIVQDRAPYPARLVTSNALDYEDGQLHGAQKGRGLGDCYWNGEWVWDGQVFVQTVESTSGMCRGITAGGAWTLPTRVADVVR